MSEAERRLFWERMFKMPLDPRSLSHSQVMLLMARPAGGLVNMSDLEAKGTA